jgi:small subunit ribosomal protein S4
MVKPGSVVTLKEKFLGTPLLKKLLEEKDIQVPAWLVRKGPVGKIERMPQRDDVAEDIDEQLIIEFYSR